MSDTAVKLLRVLPDGVYLKLRYKLKFGKKLNLKTPETFNEKLQWLKLHDRKDVYTIMVDKFKVKEYVANIIGEKYVIPTIGIYDKFDEIDFDVLPKQFVIKCTHDSGGLVIVKNKEKLDRNTARKIINKCLATNYYYRGREWPYKNVKPRIIVEKYMKDTRPIIDYKFFCFNGKPKIVLACSDRFSSDGLKETWFDSDWNLLPITEGGHKTDGNIVKPKKFNEMKQLASQLAERMAFVRIDFYEFSGRVFFGEITFFPASGFEKFVPGEWNKRLGDLIDLGIVEREMYDKM